MSVKLAKGQSVNLEQKKVDFSKTPVVLMKSEYDFSSVTIGLGWDIREEKKNVLNSFWSKGESFNYDLDAFALLLNENGKLQNVSKDVIFYGNLKSSDGSVVHCGDNLTGNGEGDDEQIVIHLSAIPEQYHQVIVGANIYQGLERKQDFSSVIHAYVRSFDANGKEICRFNLSGDIYDGQTGMVLGNLYRRNGKWKFLAMGEPKLGNLQTLADGFVQGAEMGGTFPQSKLALEKNYN